MADAADTPAAAERRDACRATAASGDLVDQPEIGTGELHRDLTRRLAAEGIGTGFLVIAVIGSGIMATRLTDDTAVQLLANAAATTGP